MVYDIAAATLLQPHYHSNWELEDPKKSPLRFADGEAFMVYDRYPKSFTCTNPQLNCGSLLFVDAFGCSECRLAYPPGETRQDLTNISGIFMCIAGCGAAIS